MSTNDKTSFSMGRYAGITLAISILDNMRPWFESSHNPEGYINKKEFKEKLRALSNGNCPACCGSGKLQDD